jgi:hypothetical protein
MQTPPRSRIVLNASNLAGLIGQHPFHTRPDAFMAAWKSTDKTSYFRAHNRNHVETIEDERRKIREASKFIQEAPPEKMLRANFANTNASCFTSMSADVESKQIAEEARRIAYTSHGDAKEDSIVERVNDVLGLDFTKTDTMLRRVIGTTRSGTDVMLQGKIDGQSADGTVLLECKTRVHKLFMQLRDYEKIQVQAYLELVPDAAKAVLVEAIFNVGSVPSINIIDVERDESGDWRTLALAMADVLDRVIRDHALQDALVTSPRKGIFLRGLLRESLEAYI